MPGYQNNMSNLLTKIERRLGLIPLIPHLPKEYNKEAWAELIKTDTLETFSRFYPKKVPFKITKETAPKKNGWYYINEDYLGSQRLLGAGDIDWTDFGNKSLSVASQFGYGLPDIGMANFTPNDIKTFIMRADYASMFQNNIYVEYQYPNKLRIMSTGNKNINIGDFTIVLYTMHSDDLTSISPTKMETFEQLAQADVAYFLSSNLRYWDGLETVLVSLDLKLSNLETEAGKRDNILDKLESSFVSAGNEAIPFFIVD